MKEFQQKLVQILDFGILLMVVVGLMNFELVLVVVLVEFVAVHLIKVNSLVKLMAGLLQAVKVS